jgi:hypothetical protein
VATLTETAYYSRIIVKYGLGILIGLVILRGSLIMSVSVYRQIFPPPPPEATVKYNKLPPLQFPQVSNLPETLTYKLETPDGSASIENFKSKPAPIQAKVFFMPQPNPSLLALERSKERAQTLGFTEEPEILGENIYRFRNSNQAATLDIHATTQAFRYYRSLDSLTGSETPPTSTSVALSSITGLYKAESLNLEMTEGNPKFTFLKLTVGGFSKVNSLSEADLVRVDLFRKDLDELPVYTSDPDQAPIWGIVSSSAGQSSSVVELNHRYFPTEREEFSTYPIKTSLEAWQELGQGKGAIAKLGDNPSGNITIRRIYLGYYDNTLGTQKFMQPIYIFEGDGGFIAYVSAVTGDWMQP